MSIEHLIEYAIILDPPKVIADYCGKYYSPYYHLMNLIVAYRDLGLCVELGIKKGRGLLSFACASSSVRVVGIDTTKRPELDFVLDEYPNVEILVQPSMPAVDLGQPIDVLHIDTEHSYSQAKNEFEAWEPYLAPGAIVLFDDLNAMEGGVARAFDELPGKKIRDDRLHRVCGYGVLIYAAWENVQ